MFKIKNNNLMNLTIVLIIFVFAKVPAQGFFSVDDIYYENCMRKYKSNVDKLEAFVKGDECKCKKENCISSSENIWYTSVLAHFNEFSFLTTDTAIVEKYRFTWLRSFHRPIIIVLEFTNNENATLVTKTIAETDSQKQKYLVFDTLFLNGAELEDLREELNSISFWKLKTHAKENGKDGAKWLLEGNKNGYYHLVKRWSPKKGNFRTFCLKLMETSKVKIEKVY